MLFFSELVLITILNSKVSYTYYISNPKINISFAKNIVSFLSYHNNSLMQILSDREMLHMLDVRTLINKLWNVNLTILIISFSSLITLSIVFKKRSISKKVIVKSSIQKLGLMSLVLGTILLTVITITFPYSFEIFHRTFFPQGNYLFPRDSVLISNLPASFFRNFLIISIIETIFVFIISVEAIDIIAKIIYKKFIEKKH